MEVGGEEEGRRNRVTAYLLTRVGRSTRMTSRHHLPQALARRHGPCLSPDSQSWANDSKRGRWGGQLG
eukprot:8337125-Alexandrium_andersonii.AAC.1